MKKTLVLVSFVLLFTGTNAFSGEMKLPNITVYGTAVKKVVPDKMLWNVQVMNKGHLLEDVTRRHIVLVGKVTSFLKSEGIKDDLQTTRMEFGENWVYRDRERVREGYLARTYVNFSMTDFSKYKKIWLGLAGIDDVSVLNVSYDLTKRVRIQNETMVKALLAAKKKAKLLADSIGSEIAEPILIEEERSGDDGIYNVRARVLDAAKYDIGGESSVSPGLIAIRARVKASFRLVTHDLQ